MQAKKSITDFFFHCVSAQWVSVGRFMLHSQQIQNCKSLWRSKCRDRSDGIKRPPNWPGCTKLNAVLGKWAMLGNEVYLVPGLFQSPTPSFCSSRDAKAHSDFFRALFAATFVLSSLSSSQRFWLFELLFLCTKVISRTVLRYAFGIWLLRYLLLGKNRELKCIWQHSPAFTTELNRLEQVIFHSGSLLRKKTLYVGLSPHAYFLPVP